MARLNLELLSGLLPIEPMLGPASQGPDAAGAGLFDAHLQRARSLVEPAPEPARSVAEAPAPSPPPRPAEQDRPAPRNDSPRDERPEEHEEVRRQEEHASKTPERKAEDSAATASTDNKPEREKEADQEPEANSKEDLAGSAAVASTTNKGNPESEHHGKRKDAGKNEDDSAIRSVEGKGKVQKPRTADKPANQESAPDASAENSKTSADPAGPQVIEAATGTADAAADSEEAKANAKKGADAAAESAQASAEANATVAAAQAGALKAPGQDGAAVPGATGAGQTEAVAEVQTNGTGARRSAQRQAIKGASDSHTGSETPDAPAEQEAAAKVPEELGDTSGSASPDATAVPQASRPEQGDSTGPSQRTEGEAGQAEPVGAKNADHGPRSAATREAQGTPGAEQADRVRFVQRVVRAFESAAERGGNVRLRLYPPELGSLRVDLTIRNGVMTARMETETESAQRMILDNLPGLRERLSEHNIRVERFDVQWNGQSAGGSPQQSGSQGPWQERRGGSGPSRSIDPDRQSASQAAPRPATRSSQGTSFDVLA